MLSNIELWLTDSTRTNVIVNLEGKNINYLAFHYYNIGKVTPLFITLYYSKKYV